VNRTAGPGEVRTAGDVRDGEQDPVAEWEAITAFAGGEGPLGQIAEEARAAGPPPAGPSARLRAPLIIDTDLGGDPDDAVAVAVAALRVPELALVITTDEVGGERARLARYLLDLAGRPEVPVAAGADLGGSKYFCTDGLVPRSVPAQAGDVNGAVRAVVSAAGGGPVRWLGIGPMTNLAQLAAADAGTAAQLAVTQMGGALAYRDPARAEHNVRLDPAAAIAVLTGMRQLTLVTSDVTFNKANEITAGSPIARSLSDPAAPPWAGLLSRHLDRWFERFHPGTMQHDALALASALGHPALDYARPQVTIADDGRMTADPGGTSLRMAARADYRGFMWWLGQQLDWQSS
jgi:inosine-uridine nucleoside N-ribohydrolase